MVGAMKRLLFLVATLDALTSNAIAAPHWELPSPITLAQFGGPGPIPPIITSVPYTWTGKQTFSGGLAISGCTGPVIGNGSSSVTCSLIGNSEMAVGAAAANLGYTPLVASNNLSDVASITTSRSNLGLGTAATKAASSGGSTVASVNGSFVVDHIAIFYDTVGTIKDGGLVPGTVTSVGLALPSIFVVSGSPVTTTGTLGATLATQTANYGFWGPASGSAAAPTFRAQVCADLPAGARCLLNTLTASSSTALSDTTSLTSAYKHYEIRFQNLIPATNASTCELQVQVGGSFVTSSYVVNSAVLNSSYSSYSPTAFIPCSYTSYWSTSGQGMSGSITIENPSQTSLYKTAIISIEGPAASGTYQYLNGGGWYGGGTGAVTGIQVFSSSGNIASGIIQIYGYN